VGTYNPLRCEGSLCEQVGELLFPSLLDVDPQTHRHAPADENSFALVTDWQFNDTGDAITLTVRDDLTWSDGTPITAADVAFTYRYLLEAVDTPFFEQIYRQHTGLAESLAGVNQADDTTVTIEFDAPDCDWLYAMDDVPVMPAHVLGLPDGTRNPEADAQFDDAPTVTGGLFEFVAAQTNAYIRLQRTNANGETLTYEIVPVASDTDELARFLNGDLTLLRDPRLTDFDNLHNNPQVETVMYPAAQWDYVAFNLADPDNPENAFDEDGNPIEQGLHPVFGDRRVRHAAQLAVNIDVVMQSAVNGHGVPLAGATVPQISPFEDPSILPPEYNLQAAQQLLDDAGWKLYPGQTVRVCDGCTTADPGTRLFIELAYNQNGSRLERAATVIAQQLRQAGFQVSIEAQNFDYASQQTFDAYVGAWFQDYPVSIAVDDLFSREADRVGNNNLNIGSYHSEELQMLLDDVQVTCDPEERQALYNEIEVILRDDAPYLWLYAPQTMTAVQAGVQNEVIPPHLPFWNVREWVIWQGGQAERNVP
jgi:peptide/nickel transport system substrate-binding protein